MEPKLRLCLAALEAVFGSVRPKIGAPHPYDKQSNSIEQPAEIEEELRELVATGDNGEAVKRMARLTDAGLRVSKDDVDRVPAISAKRH